jgi:hypothetical protein
MIKLTYILSLVALGLMIFNLFQVDWTDPIGEDSMVAVILILASGCGLMLLGILRLSIRVKTLSDNN